MRKTVASSVRCGCPRRRGGRRGGRRKGEVGGAAAGVQPVAAHDPAGDRARDQRAGDGGQRRSTDRHHMGMGEALVSSSRAQATAVPGSADEGQRTGEHAIGRMRAPGGGEQRARGVLRHQRQHGDGAQDTSGLPPLFSVESLAERPMEVKNTSSSASRVRWPKAMSMWAVSCRMRISTATIMAPTTALGMSRRAAAAPTGAPTAPRTGR